MTIENNCRFQPEQLRKSIQINEAETQDYKFELVTNSQDFYESLELVQDVYIREGYVNPSSDKSPCRILKNHHHPATAVFTGKCINTIAFTVSLFPDSGWGLPMDTIYQDELDNLRFQGRRIGEVGCLATHPDHRNGTQNILMHGNKIMFTYAMEILKLDDLVITVHPKHALVYKEVLMFEELCSGTVKSYPTVNHNPAIALRLDLHEAEEKFRHHYQHLPSESNLHHFFFVQENHNHEILDELKYETAFADSESYLS